MERIHISLIDFCSTARVLLIHTFAETPSNAHGIVVAVYRNSQHQETLDIATKWLQIGSKYDCFSSVWCVFTMNRVGFGM